MSRTFTRFATEEIRRLLTVLADPRTPADEYGRVMRVLGERLANSIVKLEPMVLTSSVCVVCTAEDADFLARGVLDQFQAAGVSAEKLKLVCFWNERIRRFEGDKGDSFDIAPVVKQYRENVDVEGSILVMVSSIVATARVLQTNLASVLKDKSAPAATIVAAPVMLAGAPEKITGELAANYVGRFESLTFAVDDEKGADYNVIPGIGGSIFERLGFPEKFTLVPDIVKQRRRQFAH